MRRCGRRRRSAGGKRATTTRDSKAVGAACSGACVARCDLAEGDPRPRRSHRSAGYEEGRSRGRAARGEGVGARVVAVAEGGGDVTETDRGWVGWGREGSGETACVVARFARAHHRDIRRVRAGVGGLQTESRCLLGRCGTNGRGERI